MSINQMTFLKNQMISVLLGVPNVKYVILK